jgi:hypothetical protein
MKSWTYWAVLGDFENECRVEYGNFFKLRAWETLPIRRPSGIGSPLIAGPLFHWRAAPEKATKHL